MLKQLTRVLCFSGLAWIAMPAAAEEFIAFCLPEWKEMHFKDPNKAQEHLAAVQKLGCEAKIDRHSDHTDVVYRSPKWKSMAVATGQLADHWEAWLKEAGFETLHGHASDHSGDNEHDHTEHGPDKAEKVIYRLPNWNSLHLSNPEQIAELTAMLKGLGCELKSSQHAGHSDLSFRCQQWTHIDVGSHEVAATWEKWLAKTGFEVQHNH